MCPPQVVAPQALGRSEMGWIQGWLRPPTGFAPGIVDLAQSRVYPGTYYKKFQK